MAGSEPRALMYKVFAQPLVSTLCLQSSSQMQFGKQAESRENVAISGNDPIFPQYPSGVMRE